TDPRHLAILENYIRHAILEVCGMGGQILAPDMVVAHPVYRFHTPTGLNVVEGMEKVGALYQSYVDSRSTVIYHTDEHVAVNDDGLYTEYVTNRFWPGSELAKLGETISDPSAIYLVSNTQAMY